jgi:Lytic polysaccharide mono-oxygenase, cellulose-degrading
MMKLLAALLLAVFFDGISGHGMLMDPVNRASRWRADSTAPKDYSDMEGFCGGFPVQWQLYGGKCGLCGDKFGDPTPRNHELGGKYGQGVVVKTYRQGQTIDVTVRITANHKGYFYFKICNLDAEKETEACFERYKLQTSSGALNWPLTSTSAGDYKLQVKLPTNLVCNRCVLQWTYVAGNNWGYCPDGTGKLGCGPQEHFRTCSDITIARA